MEFKAVTKFIRISPRKTRLVADTVRGRNALQSQALLETVNKRAARIIGKTLNSAISNARQKEVKEESLWIKKIFIDGGPLYKRYMPRAMGRATMIRRPTSHVTIILSDEVPKIKREQLETKTEVLQEDEIKKGKEKIEKKKKPEKKVLDKKVKEKPKDKKEKGKEKKKKG